MKLAFGGVRERRRPLIVVFTREESLVVIRGVSQIVCGSTSHLVPDPPQEQKQEIRTKRGGKQKQKK